jgi:hypothetical protein
MGEQRNSLRHHGMMATSPGWRRHFWPARHRVAPAFTPPRDAAAFWPVVFALWTTALANILTFWSGRTDDRR